MKYKLKDKIVFEIINEWKQLFGKFNWYTVTFVHVYFEKEGITHGYEIHFTILGLGFYFRYNTNKAMKQFAKWHKVTKKLVNKRVTKKK